MTLRLIGLGDMEHESDNEFFFNYLKHREHGDSHERDCHHQLVTVASVTITTR